MNKSTIHSIKCPHCGTPFPKKIDDVEIHNKNELIGIICPGCSNKITQEDIFIIGKRTKGEAKRLAHKFVVDALKKRGLKIK